MLLPMLSLVKKGFARGKAPDYVTSKHMAIQRMEHVGIVVEDLAAAIEFFVELGLELQGAGLVEGPWVDRIVGWTEFGQRLRCCKPRTAMDDSS